MLELDGSFGEGGGQILRTALSLSAILQKPFRISAIRRNRKRPGLQPQHLTGVNAAAELCQAQVMGNRLGSTELTFEPSALRGESYHFNVAEERGSAGSVTLVCQTILPILLLGERRARVTIQGGTHVPFSPPADYWIRVLLPFLGRLGFSLTSEIRRYGFFPVGNGEIAIETQPTSRENLTGIVLPERGELRRVCLVSAVARLPVSIAERQQQRFTSLFGPACACPHADGSGHLETEIRDVPAASPGTYVFLSCEYEHITVGFSSLGARGKPAEVVAEEAFRDFDRHQRTAGVLDPHLADQVLPFLALIAKPFSFTTSEVTQHLLTNLWVIRQFLPETRITVQGELGKPGRATRNAE